MGISNLVFGYNYYSVTVIIIETINTSSKTELTKKKVNKYRLIKERSKHSVLNR